MKNSAEAQIHIDKHSSTLMKNSFVAMMSKDGDFVGPQLQLFRDPEIERLKENRFEMRLIFLENDKAETCNELVKDMLAVS
ncbi:hypothetical protein Trydic_g623 [Trypoxylus dichotomus]